MKRTMSMLAAMLLAAAPALAQQPGSPPPGSPPPGSPPLGSPPPGAPPPPMPGMHHNAPRGDAPSTQGYRAAMMKMHRDMDIQYSGNADRDFVAGMIPHHQGAIDMARIELRYGRDPQLKRLAQDVVRAQEKEIAFMRQWQARHAR